MPSEKDCMAPDDGHRHSRRSRSVRANRHDLRPGGPEARRVQGHRVGLASERRPPRRDYQDVNRAEPTDIPQCETKDRDAEPRPWR